MELVKAAVIKFCEKVSIYQLLIDVFYLSIDHQAKLESI